MFPKNVLPPWKHHQLSRKRLHFRCSRIFQNLQTLPTYKFWTPELNQAISAFVLRLEKYRMRYFFVPSDFSKFRLHSNFWLRNDRSFVVPQKQVRVQHSYLRTVARRNFPLLQLQSPSQKFGHGNILNENHRF